MGDSCCDPDSIGSVKKLIEDTLGVFVLSIATGSSEVSDVVSSYLGDVNEQVSRACQAIREAPELARGYNAVGFSQGGQFMRAVVQRCNHLGPQAHRLITFGAQHQGVMTLPGCGTDRGMFCDAMRAVVSQGAYLSFVQKRVVQAQYFKDPFNLDAYMAHGVFLPDINNERQAKVEQYATNLAGLDAFVMFKFEDDEMVVPPESSWFGFFNGTVLLPLTEQPLYSEDWLGLRALDEGGRLVRAAIPGAHMHFSIDWFRDDVVRKWLAGGAQVGAAADGAEARRHHREGAAAR